MKRLFASIVVSISLLAPAHAQSGKQAPVQPTEEDIVRALTPKAAGGTKSLKGVELIPGKEEGPPSIDLTVNFAYASAKLETDTLLVLRSLGLALKDPRLLGYGFVIAGHTDAKGDDKYNQRLSEARAIAVREHLLFYHGVDGERLAAVGFGETKLLKPDAPDDGANRRVQIINRSKN